jgi:peptidyl-prolyl cis-trans isomerase B (cyclophilin B)
VPSSSSRQYKRDAKRAREAAREAARRRERQRTVQTAIVVLIAMAIGGTIIALSIRNERVAAEQLASELPTEDLLDESVTAQSAVPACVPEPPPEPRPELPKPTFAAPEQVLNPESNYRAVIETSCGRLVFQLLEDDAPETVNSFVFLARQGFFDGLEIFRNAPGIAALQTGAGDNTNAWDLGYTIPDEFGRAQAEQGYRFGALAMAKTAEPNSGGSQFFMIYGPTTLTPDYTLFGQLVEGSEALASIGAIPNAEPDSETPGATVVLESVTIEEVPGAPLGPLAPVDTPPLPTAEPTEEQS